MRELAVAVLRRPRLWPVAVVQAWRLMPTGWWRRRPFLPVPTRDYRRFRSVTHTGVAEGGLDPAAVAAYLAWCRQWRSMVRPLWKDVRR